MATNIHSQPSDAPSPTPVPPAIDQEVGDNALTDQEVPVDASFGYVRIWVMIPQELPADEFGAAPKLRDSLSLSYRTADGNEETLISNPYPYMIGGYREISPGKRTFQLNRKKGGESEVVGSLEMDVESKSFSTIAITKKGTSYQLEAIPDTETADEKSQSDASDTEPKKQIVCFNFLPGAKVVVSSVDPKFSVEVQPGNPVTIPDLPSKVFTMTTDGSYDGKSISGEFEVDLSGNDSMSYVIIQDIYGRTVPALLPSGKLD